MKEVILNGRITEGSEWDTLYIDGESLAEYAEEFNGGKAKLTYYISNEPIDQNTINEKLLKSYYEGTSSADTTYCHGSSWTGVYWRNDEFHVGGHDIVEELSEHKGKYCLIIINAE